MPNLRLRICRSQLSATARRPRAVASLRRTPRRHGLMNFFHLTLLLLVCGITSANTFFDEQSVVRLRLTADFKTLSSADDQSEAQYGAATLTVLGETQKLSLPWR